MARQQRHSLVENFIDIRTIQVEEGEAVQYALRINIRGADTADLRRTHRCKQRTITKVRVDNSRQVFIQSVTLAVSILVGLIWAKYRSRGKDMSDGGE